MPSWLSKLLYLGDYIVANIRTSTPAHCAPQKLSRKLDVCHRSKYYLRCSNYAHRPSSSRWHLTQTTQHDRLSMLCILNAVLYYDIQ